MRVLLLLLALAAISQSPARAADPVILGAVYNTTGRQAVLDQPSEMGARLAVKETNAEGGVLGRPVALATVDGESRPETVATRTTALTVDHPSVAALLGLSDSDMALAAGRAAAGAGRLFLTSGATSPKLPAEVPEFLFLACFGDNVQAAAAAEWAYRSLGARTAAVVFNSERTYTRLLHGYFQARFEELGGRIVSVTSYRPGAMQDVAAGVKTADMVFLSSEETGEAVEGVTRFRAAGIAVPVLGGDGYDTPKLWAERPELGEVYYTTHAYLADDNPDPAVQAFLLGFEAEYGKRPDGFAALGYDAARLLVDAVGRAGSDDPEAVRASLAATDGFRGVTGTIGFAGGSRIPRKSVALLSVSGGTVALVSEVMPERVPAP